MGVCRLGVGVGVGVVRPSTPTPTDPLRQLTAADRVESPAPAGALVAGDLVAGDLVVGVAGALLAGDLVSVPRRVATISRCSPGRPQSNLGTPRASGRWFAPCRNDLDRQKTRSYM